MFSIYHSLFIGMNEYSINDFLEPGFSYCAIVKRIDHGHTRRKNKSRNLV